MSTRYDAHLEQFVRIAERTLAGRQVQGGIVFKYEGRVLAFGDVPAPYRSPEPLPEALKQPETAPGQDDILPVVRVNHGRFWLRAMTQRNLGLGEAFIDGDFTMENGAVWHMVAFLIRNELDKQVDLTLGEKAKLFATYLRWRWQESQNAHIADHYDMGDDVMTPMLGGTGIYSCGYHLSEADTLEDMQRNKMNLIFSKLALRPGERVLDTGCGNGGCLVHAAQAYGVTGEGFTNSWNMARLARENAARNGLAEKLAIKVDDFRSLRRYPSESFDAIFETGAWEHLPYEDYGWIMRECHRILKPNGRMLVHSMGDHRFRHVRDEYIQKYIFRDSNQVILSKLAVEAEKLGMYVADLENLGRHYYYTLWHWHRNLMAAQDGVKDKRKLRVQEYFLQCCMAESRFGDAIVYHLLLHKNPRAYRDLHRVTKESMSNRPLVMRPHTENAVKLDAPDADPSKFEQAVYERPSLARRAERLVNLVTSFYH